MGIAKSPFKNRGPIELTSISTALTYGNPIGYVHVISAGSGGLVVKAEDGTAQTYTGLVAGDVIRGPFSELTSMTLSKIRVGDGESPRTTSFPPAPATGSALGSVEITGTPVNAATPIAVGQTDLDFVGVKYQTAATQTASFTAAIDTLWIVNATNTAATATLPAIAAANDGHRVAIFNAGTTASVWTPASGDCVGGTAASNATAAGPAAGNMATLIANLATRRWIPLK